MKQYKAVSGPLVINVDRGEVQAAFDSYASIINSEARNGWDYHSMSTITVSERQGCLTPPVQVNHYMLIFVREV